MAKKRKKEKMSKTLKVVVACQAAYTSTIQVPDDYDLENAMEYAQEHLDEIPATELEWISGEEEILHCEFVSVLDE